MSWLNLDKVVGPVTGKYCVRKFHSLWAVYDERGVWWGHFETFSEALWYATHPAERLENWLTKQC